MTGSTALRKAVSTLAERGDGHGGFVQETALSVADFLELEAVRFAMPSIVSGKLGATRLISWIHVSELADIAGYLDGGELILTTGIALPDTPQGLCAYIRDLDRAGASGLVLGLGRRFTQDHIPRVMLDLAETLNFPIIVLGRETPFVRITAEVHRTIISAQNEAVRKAEEVSRTFIELSIEGAGPAEILKQIAVHAHCPVLLESTAHQLLAYDTAGFDLSLIVDNWERNSRKVESSERVGHDAATRWLVGRISARGHDWGRLILMTDVAGSVATRALMERAISALAVHNLLAVDSEPMDRRAQRELLNDVRTHAVSPEDLSLRMRALGVVVRERRFLGLVARIPVRSPGPPAQHRQDRARLVEAIEQAIGVARLTGITGDMGSAGVQSILSIPADRPETAVLDQVTAALHSILADVTVGIGSATAEFDGIARSLIEADQAVGTAQKVGSTAPYFRLSDVRLRGLFYALRQDGRLQTFVEREIGALLAYDAKHETQLMEALRVYLWSGRNKSAAAEAAHMSRPAFYQRLLRLEHILGVDLDSVDDCLSLHVALLAHQVLHA